MINNGDENHIRRSSLAGKKGTISTNNLINKKCSEETNKLKKLKKKN